MAQKPEPIRVRVLYFAAARERAGTGGETLELPPGASARDIREATCALHPALRPIAERLRLAIDQEFVPDDHPLRGGEEAALIPPVSGGSRGRVPADATSPSASTSASTGTRASDRSAGERHRIVRQPLSPEAAIALVSGADCGAVVTFLGVVRSQSKGKDVVGLDYEAYPDMALRIFARIESEAQARWPGARLVIHHRVGSLEPGELSVVIAAAAPHRADAFSACRHAIEELKRDAPIWKRERYPDGSSWVGLGS